MYGPQYVCTCMRARRPRQGHCVSARATLSCMMCGYVTMRGQSITI